MAEVRDFTGGHGDIEWHQAKIREYFNACFEEIYNPFVDELQESFINALLAFVNDENHQGAEADASKAFINEKQIMLVYDTVSALARLRSMMQGGGCDSVVSLLDDFLESLSEDESDTAVIKTAQLNKIINDYSTYNTSFKAITPEVKSIHDAVETAVANCPVVTRKIYTDPDPATADKSLDDFTTTDGTEGFVPIFLKNFLDFHERHSNDIEGSPFKATLDAIVFNLNQIVDGIGDGSFDISRYFDTQNNIKWINVKDVLEGAALTEYQEFLVSMATFFLGFLPECLMAIADPVIANNGNYINDRTDLTVGGKHKLEVKRFYNALSEKTGLLGKGWTTPWDEHLTVTEDKIKSVYADGREGVYVRANLGEESVYLEEHGEPGILKETETGYRISQDSGEYKDFDREGYLVALGDNFGQHTKIEYNLIGEAETAVPVKVETKEGTYLLFAYDEEARLVKITDHTGRALVYDYDENGYLTKITYPNHTTRRYEYTENGLIHAVISPDGATALVNDYDEKRRVTHQKFPDGGEISYSYDEENHITHVVEQNGNKVDYITDELGRHIGTRYPELGIEERYTYNDRNQKISVTDKNGYTTRYTYDNRGHLTGVIGANGFVERYTYNADGKLIAKKDSEGNSYKFKYDLEGNLYCMIDPEGNKTKYEYEGGKLVCIRDAEDKQTVITYDENGNVDSVTDPAGVTTRYICDELGRVTQTIDPEGNATSYTYAEDDNITSVTDPLGNITGYKYNAAGQVTAIINPDGTTRRWTYNNIGKPGTFIDEENRRTHILYNTSWNQEKVVLPNGGITSYEYDLLGNLTSIIDPEGRKMDYRYDNAGNILEESKQDVTTSFAYDALGRVIKETDGEGNVTRYEYDNNGNVICKTDAKGGKTCQEFDSLGRVIKLTDPLGRVTTYTYDKLGNLETATEPSGVVNRNYFENGRLLKVTKKAPEGEEIIVKAYEYNACGKVQRFLARDGFAVDYVYDKAGRVLTVTGSNGRVISYEYDKMGRITATVDDGSRTEYTYTGTGKLESVTDALGNKTEYTYNELDLLTRIDRFGDGAEDVRTVVHDYDLSGKLISTTDVLGNTETYQYDGAGNLISQIGRDGEETLFTRDRNGNITGIKYPDGKDILYKYDALNILKEVKDHLGITRIESDILGRTVKVTNPGGETVGYEYGISGERTALIYPDGRRAEYSYDALGRLVSLHEDKNANEGFTYAYDNADRLINRSFPNGTSTSYEYYQGGLLKSLVSADKTGILDRYEYSYDKKGNRTRISRQRRDLAAISGTYAYRYDDLGRLTDTFKDGVQTGSYEYDSFGNRVRFTTPEETTTYSYDVLDRLTGKNVSGADAASFSYDYDARGNLVSERQNDRLIRTYDYDAVGILKESVANPETAERSVTTYAYNFMGQRVLKATDDSRISYITDLTRDHYNVLGQTMNGVTTEFTYDGNVVSISRGAESVYYQHDELGSTMYLTGTDGAAYSPYAYDPFGNRLDPSTGKRNRGYSKDGNIIQPFAFTGYQEEENGLYFAQARSYDPTAGRFTSEDRVKGIIEFPTGQNRYQYCYNNPTIFVDRNGQWPSLSDIKEGLSNAVDKVKEVKDNCVEACLEWGEAHPVAAAIVTAVAATAATVVVGMAVTAAAPVILGAMGVGAVAGGIITATAAGAAAAAAGSIVSQGVGMVTNRAKHDAGMDWKAVGREALIGGATGFVSSGLGAFKAVRNGSKALTAAKGATRIARTKDIQKGLLDIAKNTGVGIVAASSGTGSAINSAFTQYQETGQIDPGKVLCDGLIGAGRAALTYVGMKWVTGGLKAFCTESAGHPSSEIPDKSFLDDMPKEDMYDGDVLPISPEALEKAKEAGLTPDEVATLRQIKNGKKPDPETYIPKDYMDETLEDFRDNGVYKILGDQRGDPTGTIGKDGVYVISGRDLNVLLKEADGNPRTLEKLLAMDPDYLGDNPYIVRVDNPQNMRFSSGNEPNGWQDQWCPAATTRAGTGEIVIDPPAREDYSYRQLNGSKEWK